MNSVMQRDNEHGRVAVDGRRTDDGDRCTLVVVSEVGRTWAFYPTARPATPSCAGANASPDRRRQSPRPAPPAEQASANAETLARGILADDVQ
ncbi:MAG: hypothetical protein LC799_09130 [Actinobacteria bacterium]|nr:hypothetical protein [Actinomycetota bacterium]